MNHDRIGRCLEGGTAILVASISRENVPSCCRGIALTSDDDLATAVVYLPLASSQETIANIATTHRIAVSATHPIEHASVQIKGTAGTARLAGDDEAALLRLRLDEMAGALDRIGLPVRVTHRLAYWPAYAVEIRVEEIYDQTPGPNAGKRLR